MSDETFMLESFNDTSGRLAVFEDDDTSAWLYLSGANDRKPIADVWVHNRISAPLTSEIENYRGVVHHLPHPDLLMIRLFATIQMLMIGHLPGATMATRLFCTVTAHPLHYSLPRIAKAGHET